MRVAGNRLRWLPALGARSAEARDANVFADKTLAVSITGPGDGIYIGNAVVKKSVAGSGSVVRR